LRWELVSRNAAAAAKPPRPQTEEVTPLSRIEVRLLLKTAKEEGNRLEALYILAIGAGLRHGELLGLQWADVRLFADGGEASW
jgi:integrase